MRQEMEIHRNADRAVERTVTRELLGSSSGAAGELSSPAMNAAGLPENVFLAVADEVSAERDAERKEKKQGDTESSQHEKPIRLPRNSRLGRIMRWQKARRSLRLQLFL